VPPARAPQRVPFGTLADGRGVECFTLRNARGLEVRVMTYGAALVAVRAPDRNGALDDIVLGFDSLDAYVAHSPYFGATVGRYANRIANGRFTLDGVTYDLPRNNGPNTLHGGPLGFDKAAWDAEPFVTGQGAGVTFTHVSPDGDQGFPGTVHVRVTYTLTSGNTLVIDYAATTDRATPINLTNHAYFNLRGAGTGDILGHVVRIRASRYTPVDAALIPTGELASVEGTPFDFRRFTPIGARIDQPDPQLELAHGCDHNFVLDPCDHAGQPAGGVVELGSGPPAAEVFEPVCGRTLSVWTTEPGVQFYTGNSLHGPLVGHGHRVYERRSGFCLETQHFPDSPNQPGFPSTVLRPGAEYRSRTVYGFGIRNGPGEGGEAAS
jgi:aldose 1-epimerase